MDAAILEILRPNMKTDEDEGGHFSLPSYNNNNTNPESNEDRSDIILSKIENLLLKGDRKEAVNYAMQEDLWAHALIISSCVDKDLWQKVVSGFVEREMNASPESKRNRSFNNIAGDNQALRVMYSLFSGAGAAALNEFLQHGIEYVPTPYGVQPKRPQADSKQLVKWRDTLAIVLANRTGRDIEAITALGDIMKEQNWIHAAHIW
jgi:hypothetical protein